MLDRLDFPVRRLVGSGGGVLARGIDGTGPVEDFLFGMRPSSFRKASAVAAASPTFIDCALDRERVESERLTPDEDRFTLCELIDPGGVRDERFVPEDDPRRN